MRHLHLLAPLLLLPACHGSSSADDSGSPPPEGVVVVAPSDAPWVNILTPTGMQSWEASGASLEVRGEAADTAVAVTWNNEASGASGAVSGTSDWSMTLALVEGVQRYTFTASETAGWEGSASLEILYQPGVTLGRPELSAPVVLFGEAVEVGARIEASGAVEGVRAVFDCDVGSFEQALNESEAGHWTAQFTAGTDEQRCELRVEATAGGEAVRSLSRGFAVHEPLLEERIDEVLALHGDVAEQIDAGNSDPEAAFEAAAGTLADRDDIAAVGWDEGHVWWRTRDDLMFSVSLAPEGDVAGAAPVVPAPMPSFSFPSGLSVGDLPDKSILAFNAIGETGADTELLTGDQGGYGCGSFDVTDLSGASADLANLDAGLDMGIIYIQTHGDLVAPGACSGSLTFPYWWHCGMGQGPFGFLTNDAVDGAFITAHQAEIQAFEVVVDTRVFVQGPHYDTSTPFNPMAHPIVTPGWVDSHVAGGDLDGSLVLMLSCSSGRNTSLSDMLATKGAAAYVGFSHTVYVSYGETFFGALLASWFDGRRLSEAFDVGLEAVDGQDDDVWTNIHFGDVTDPPTPAWPRAFANHDLPTYGSMVLNGGFEEGDSWWQYGGTAEIGGAVYGYTAEDGTEMLHLELDPNASQGFAWATQWVAESLPAGPYTLSFDYRILTEYSNVDCGNSSDPWFVVRVDPGGWTDIPSGGSAVEHMVPSDFCTDVADDGWLFVGDWTEDDIQFELASDMSADAFLTFMAGTSYWDEHHVLIDQVKLYPGDCAD